MSLTEREKKYICLRAEADQLWETLDRQLDHLIDISIRGAQSELDNVWMDSALTLAISELMLRRLEAQEMEKTIS